MITLASIIHTFEAQFMAQYQHRLLPSHLKALAAMKSCRSEMAPKMLATCSECDQFCYVPHSCGHRNCPHCQHHESQQWIERQLQKQLPCDYFMITFTLPAELRPLVWRHQRELYSMLMQCAWQTVKAFSQNDRALQGIPGATAVLHTHSRALDFHPHVHLIMPAGAINAKQRLWRDKKTNHNTRKNHHTKTRKPYLFNQQAMAKVFRAKMLSAITKAGLKLPAQYPQKWVVDCRYVGSGQKALIYLGRYLYRGVIAENDIIACKDGIVAFRYRESKTKQFQYRRLSGVKFLRLLLKHVLPRGFRRARNYGFLHPNSKRLIQLLHYLGKLKQSVDLPLVTRRAALICRCCGAEMKIIGTKIRFLSSPRLSQQPAMVPT